MRLLAKISWSVQSSINRTWVSAFALEDVNLAATGPSFFGDVHAEHPECRPGADTLWHFQSRFETPILEANFFVSRNLSAGPLGRCAVVAVILVVARHLLGTNDKV